jgi:hypothetical protein
MGPRDGLDSVAKKKILSPRLESNPRTPIAQPYTKFLAGNPEGKRQLRSPTAGWEGNIRMDLTEVGWVIL